MIYAVVVTYNPEESLLVSQHKALCPQVHRIVYVDNNSINNSCFDQLVGEKSQVIINNKNLGLAAAQNIGIEIAKKEGSDFVLLMDQDSIPPEGFVAALLNCFNECSIDYKVALVGPAILNRNSQLASNDNTGVIIKGGHVHYVPLSSITEVSFCIASGSLIHTSVFDKVGLMQSKLFIDGLDLEWCLRAKYKGYHIFQTNKTCLSHCLGDGTPRRIKSHSPQREYYIVRNSVWMMKQKHIPAGYRIRKAFTTIGRIFTSLFHFDFPYLQAELKGVLKGIIL